MGLVVSAYPLSPSPLPSLPLPTSPFLSLSILLPSRFFLLPSSSHSPPLPHPTLSRVPLVHVLRIARALERLASDDQLRREDGSGGAELGAVTPGQGLGR